MIKYISGAPALTVPRGPGLAGRPGHPADTVYWVGERGVARTAGAEPQL